MFLNWFILYIEKWVRMVTFRGASINTDSTQGTLAGTTLFIFSENVISLRTFVW